MKNPRSMLKLLWIALLLSIILPCHSQTPITLRSTGKVKDLQVFPVGDSLLLPLPVFVSRPFVWCLPAARKVA
jgi:hypothetical protein